MIYINYVDYYIQYYYLVFLCITIKNRKWYCIKQKPRTINALHNGMSRIQPMQCMHDAVGITIIYCN